jgi:AcrR family transcriptional regulator
MEKDPRTERILEVAIELAEQEGYDAVRLRDLAAKADVALGTVYRRFSSKEDILAAVLEREVQQLSDSLGHASVPGETVAERLNTFFGMATRFLVARPNLARALLRSVASGVPDIAEKVTRYHGTMAGIIVAVVRGEPVREDAAWPTGNERTLAALLQQAWFAVLVGWSGGLHTVDEALADMEIAVRVILHGVTVLETES